MVKKQEIYINRDISWLHFNDRVMQEAQSKEVPLIERAKFLGIFSNNLDEFFRVRVATIKRMVTWGKGAVEILHDQPKELLKKIHDIVLHQQEKFNKTYENLIKELEKENIFLLDEKGLDEKQLEFVRQYFNQKVRPALVPIMLTNKLPFPDLKDKSIYLAIKLHHTKKGKKEADYALIEVPSEDLSRFVQLPREQNRFNLILLDDVIRVGLKNIFAVFQYEHHEAYTIKITRDAELDFSEDISDSFLNKMTKSLQNRKQGQTVRFIYDEDMPEDLLDFIIKKNKLKRGDNIIAGGRYHNFKDFIKFPKVGSKTLQYPAMPPLEHRELRNEVSLLSVIRKKDVLLHFPYHSFDYVIDIMREAAINPNVSSIKMTLYRVANNSRIVNALINAARNGKNVTVVIELQARFDEERNIQWAHKLQEEGVKIIFGVPGLKVHSKLILIKEKIGKRSVYYGHVGTGNFHEGTARAYTDMSLFTTDARITNEIRRVFDFMKDNYKRSTYRQLFVSPTNTRRNFIKLIENEIKNVKKGLPAYITIKVNNLVDEEMIQKLHEAGAEGVKVELIVRGACSMSVQPTKFPNIRIISIVDRFLEHSRIFVFCNGGSERFYISSADWMARNLDKRLEVTTPILDKDLQQQIRNVLQYHLNDNASARVVDPKGKNKFLQSTTEKKVRSQQALYKYYKDALS